MNRPDCLREWTAGRIAASIPIAAAFVRKQVAPNLLFPTGTIDFRGQKTAFAQNCSKHLPQQGVKSRKELKIRESGFLLLGFAGMRQLCATHKD